jgi:hypothetical protein
MEASAVQADLDELAKWPDLGTTLYVSALQAREAPPPALPPPPQAPPSPRTPPQHGPNQWDPWPAPAQPPVAPWPWSPLVFIDLADDDED